MSSLTGDLIRLSRHPDADQLTIRQIAVLACVKEKPGCSNREVMQTLIAKAPTVSRALAALESIGLLNRESNDEDRRTLVLNVTPRGDAMLAAASAE